MKTKRILFSYMLLAMLLGYSCSNDDFPPQDEEIDEVVMEGLYDLYIYDIERASTTRITDSPDSTEIDIRTSKVDNNIIFQGDQKIQMVDIVGENLKTVVANYAYGGYDLSLDNKKITYSDGNFVFIANIDGTDNQQLTNDDRKLYRPKFAPDGSQILASGENGLYLVDFNGEVEQIFEEEMESAVVDATIWSFDSSKVAFDLYTGTTSKILVYDIETKNLEDYGSGYRPVWHPSKLEILFNRVVSSSTTELLLVGEDRIERTILDDRGFHSNQKWSPDGQKIVLVNGEGNVVIIKHDGSDYKEINEIKGASWEPNWTFDGKHIVYYRAIWYS